jgi:hypothetical protein
MARGSRITIEIEDVNGSFAKMIKAAPKEVRAFLSQAVSTTTVAVKQRMQVLVPVEEGDLKAAIDTKLPKGNRLMGQAGVFDPEQAEVALLNEYRPNTQPFMRPAALDEAEDFKQRAIRALKKAEAALAGTF